LPLLKYYNFQSSFFFKEEDKEETLALPHPSPYNATGDSRREPPVGSVVNMAINHQALRPKHFGLTQWKTSAPKGLAIKYSLLFLYPSQLPPDL